VDLELADLELGAAALGTPLCGERAVRLHVVLQLGEGEVLPAAAPSEARRIFNEARAKRVKWVILVLM